MSSQASALVSVGGRPTYSLVTAADLSFSRKDWLWEGKHTISDVYYINKLSPSWQSSLTLSLLRCIFTEGKVYYDGLSTDSINLDSLRSNITIIPQIVSVLHGTHDNCLFVTYNSLSY